MNQIMRGIAYLHEQRIIHRDIKPDNILFVSGPPGIGCGKLKICDLGSAVKMTKLEPNCYDLYGTSYYMSPEMTMKRYSFKTDVWSAGIINYMLLSLKIPYADLRDAVILKKIEHEDFLAGKDDFRKMTLPCMYFMKRLLVRAPQNRLSSFNAVNEQFLRKGRDPYIHMEMARDCLAQIQKFVKFGVIQTAVTKFYVDRVMNTNESDHYHELFVHFNSSRTGHMDRLELLEIYNKYGFKNFTIYDLDRLFSKVDHDKSGYLEFEEFFQAAILGRHMHEIKRSERAFSEMDLDHSGGLQIDEIRTVFSRFMKPGERLNDGDLRTCFAVAPEEDLNLTVTQVEFRKFIRRIFYEIDTI